jgi:serine/threonine protein kinase
MCISHGGVKQNILVDSGGHARLSDIGFAKLASTGESTFDWAQLGADGCRWAAPEIFQNGEFSKTSDIFTYGFLAVEVRPPNCRLI